MSNTGKRIIQILINVGLSKKVAQELSIEIDMVYEDERRKKLSEYGRKGGQSKVLKGTKKLKQTDHAKYMLAKENYRRAALKREAAKRSARDDN